MDAYGLGCPGLDGEPAGKSSEASKKGDSAGWIAGGVVYPELGVGVGDEVAVVVASSSVCSASGEEMAGMCLLVPAVSVEALLACRETGKRPRAFLLTVTCVAFARMEEEGERLDP